MGQQIYPRDPSTWRENKVEYGEFAHRFRELCSQLSATIVIYDRLESAILCPPTFAPSSDTCSANISAPLPAKASDKNYAFQNIILFADSETSRFGLPVQRQYEEVETAFLNRSVRFFI